MIESIETKIVNGKVTSIAYNYKGEEVNRIVHNSTKNKSITRCNKVACKKLNF
jgi:hypothetical protein